MSVDRPTFNSDLRPGPATLVLGFGTLVTHGFGLSLIPAMLAFIAVDLDAGYDVLGIVVAVGLVAYALGAFSAGWILERSPSRATLIGSYVISAAGLLVVATAESLGALAVGAAVMGFVAPVSWAVTIHIAGAKVPYGSRAMVMSSASSGAALGVLINGVLVRTTSTVHSWRVSFVLASALALAPIAGAVLAIRSEVPRPTRSDNEGIRRSLRRALSARPGRIVLIAGLVAGVAGFPFNAFLTATALDEMGASALFAGGLWWLIGGLGMIAGPLLGRFGDRTSPLRALAIGAGTYCVGLIVLAAGWSYMGLVVAAIGYATMNYPIWGLTGVIANREFGSANAVRVVGLGLVGAALGGASANAVSGWWIERAASFRGPVFGMACVMVALSVWYAVLLSDESGRRAREMSEQ